MGVECHACIGGTTVREDMRILRESPHVIVGTPGRVYDMIQRGALDVGALKMFVLDEADEMLSRGFEQQIRDLFTLLPSTTQVYKKNNTDILILFLNKFSRFLYTFLSFSLFPTRMSIINVLCMDLNGMLIGYKHFIPNPLYIFFYSFICDLPTGRPLVCYNASRCARSH